MNNKIKDYWEERAQQNPTAPTATTNDVYLRELEIATLVDTLGQLSLPQNASLVDVGCGDGHSTLSVAQEMPGQHFLGLDYSENMIQSARRNLEHQPELQTRVEFGVGDVLELDRTCEEAQHDVALTDRCLINLESAEAQARAIEQIAKRIKPGGYYVAIENFVEGQENLNQARHSVGLPEIPVRWHNLFFKEDEFIRSAEPFFEDIQFKDFSSSYYFATRVIYSAMCRMRDEEPDYRHEIHQLSVHLPWSGQFSPIRMAVLRRK